MTKDVLPLHRRNIFHSCVWVPSDAASVLTYGTLSGTTAAAKSHKEREENHQHKHQPSTEGIYTSPCPSAESIQHFFKGPLLPTTSTV